MNKILVVINVDLSPPWSDGLKVFARGLTASIEKINSGQVETSKLDGVTEKNYDYVHIVSTGAKAVIKATRIFKRSTIFKHIVTPAFGSTTAINTNFFYTFVDTFGSRLIKCFSSDFVAQSYFMQSGFIIPPSVNTADFSKSDHNLDGLAGILDKSQSNIGIANLREFSNDLVLYSGPLSTDRFPYVQVLNGIKEAKSKILILGRNTTYNDYDSLGNIIQYAKKIGIEDKVAVGVRTLNEEEKINLINCASVVIQPFYNKSRRVAVDPPIFLLESMSCGKPVITSGAYSLETVIRDGYNGYIIDWNDSRQFSDALQNALDNSNIGPNARTTIVENFSVESVSGKIRSMYNEFE